MITYSPSILPTTTPAIGPLNGISDTHSAKDAPNIAVISGEHSCSTDNTVFTTCTSLRKPSANNGRIGRSIIRAVNVACSLGLPSLLKKPPGILPTEYNFSSNETVNGKKSIPSFACLLAVAVDNTTVSLYLTKTDPPACFATSPVSTVIPRPQKSKRNTCLATIFTSYFFIFLMISYFFKERNKNKNKKSSFELFHDLFT